MRMYAVHMYVDCESSQSKGTLSMTNLFGGTCSKVQGAAARAGLLSIPSWGALEKKRFQLNIYTIRIRAWIKHKHKYVHVSECIRTYTPQSTVYITSGKLRGGGSLGAVLGGPLVADTRVRPTGKGYLRLCV